MKPNICNPVFAHEKYHKGGIAHFLDPIGLTIGKGEGGPWYAPFGGRDATLTNPFGGGGTDSLKTIAEKKTIADLGTAPVPNPPTKGDAAKKIMPWGLAKRKSGQASTILSQSSLEDSLKSLLGQ